jgi:hypothetical protein
MRPVPSPTPESIYEYSSPLAINPDLLGHAARPLKPQAENIAEFKLDGKRKFWGSSTTNIS